MISVIMSVYKEPPAFLKASVDSILSQTYSDLEFIIVLDNPENREALHLLQTYAAGDSRVRILQNEKNLGLTASLNRALKEVAGEYVARMDADDISMPRRLEQELEYLQSHQLDLVGSEAQNISETGEKLLSRLNCSFSPEITAQLLLLDNCVPHPSWLLRRRVYEELRGYRELNACEDYDFLLRAVKAGFRIGVCSQVLLEYRINTQGISRSNLLRQELSADFLRTHLNTLDSLTQADMDAYLAPRCTEAESKKYAQADFLLSQYKKAGRAGRKTAYLKMLLLPFRSRFMLRKIQIALRVKQIRARAK